MLQDDKPQGQHRIRVLPDGLEFSANHDELVMAAANRAGIFWPTTCGGVALCTRCGFDTVPGSESHLSPPEEQETEILGRYGFAPLGARRLACRARVLGDVEITKKFVRMAKDGDTLPFRDAKP